MEHFQKTKQMSLEDYQIYYCNELNDRHLCLLKQLHRVEDE